MDRSAKSAYLVHVQICVEGGLEVDSPRPKVERAALPSTKKEFEYECCSSSYCKKSARCASCVLDPELFKKCRGRRDVRRDRNDSEDQERKHE